TGIMQRSINLLYFDSLILLVMVVSLDQKSNRRCKILRFTLVSEDFYKTQTGTKNLSHQPCRTG
ncbi:MAG: hypothetical protein KGH82_05710, partial [Candidatus Micrarchaeota archaeon]|nr:hypothetical protein [Candidatus Micrarchaeota archaeon]